jgi:hypothetical protein
MSKKSFKDTNPVLQFITQPTQGAQDTQDTHNTARETKSKRLNLLIFPSIHEDMGKIARVDGVSVNELINKVLDDYRKERAAAIARYHTIWGDK